MSGPEELSSLFLKSVLFSNFLFSCWVLYPSTQCGKVSISQKPKKGLWNEEKKIFQVKENSFFLKDAKSPKEQH